MKVFFDTNVLVAAFATRGLCADLLRAVLVEHRLVITPIVVEELDRSLAEKIGLPAETIAAVHEFLEPYCVHPETESSAPGFGLRDAADEAVVASALAARADLIVSGDRDLVEAQLPIRVVTPRGLWDLLRARQ